MPTLNLSAVDYSRVVNKSHAAIELESAELLVVLLPAMGRVYRVVNKDTAHDVLWRNDIARPGGANNKLGWWLWLGGVEYTARLIDFWLNPLEIRRVWVSVDVANFEH